jgi:hypothetical protein
LPRNPPREPPGENHGADVVRALGALVIEAVGVVENMPCEQRKAFGLEAWLLKARGLLA